MQPVITLCQRERYGLQGLRSFKGKGKTVSLFCLNKLHFSCESHFAAEAGFGGRGLRGIIPVVRPADHDFFVQVLEGHRCVIVGSEIGQERNIRFFGINKGISVEGSYIVLRDM